MQFIARLKDDRIASIGFKIVILYSYESYRLDRFDWGLYIIACLFYAIAQNTGSGQYTLSEYEHCRGPDGLSCIVFTEILAIYCIGSILVWGLLFEFDQLEEKEKIGYYQLI